MNSLWQSKLLALLHDPPDKAYNYGPEHVRKAASNAKAFGLSADYESKDSDWNSAAADRFIAPKAPLGEGVKFHHPLAGKTCALGEADFPTQTDAEAIVSDSIPSFKGVEAEQDKFWNAWRLWLHFAATHHSGQRQLADRIAYLPADTRIPDTSIWNHCAVASALESTRTAGGSLKPAFLIFQLGPVQEFIAQAQSTRDLWSGSFLLSWLMAHAMKACADTLGPDSIIFPTLRGQPLYDWLERSRLESARFSTNDGNESKSFWETFQLDRNQQLPLTPGFPNRFLALVPEDFDVENIVGTALKKEWQSIADHCWSWLENLGLAPADRPRWDFQVANHWRIHWQVMPWSEAEEALEALSQISGGGDAPINKAKIVADALQKRDDKDDRCFRYGKLNTGWAWSAHYQLCQNHLEARRQTREFGAWKGKDQAVKDAFSGKEEAVVFDQWFEKAYEKTNHLFRHTHPLGAPNLIKRTWHLAYLAAHKGFDKDAFNFPSIPDLIGPGKYYAVLALDGDEIGRWLSGEKTPAVRDVVTDKTAEWFEANLGGPSKPWLNGSRPLSPGYHMQFSEALANFGLHCTRRIVERHGGQLIYSGGDDVLALLPADDAIACAHALRKAFRGDPALEREFPDDFLPAPEGFVRLKNPKPSDPSWTLLVPGPTATVSVGIAIGHSKEPLQDMIKEAQSAEKHAKSGLGRNALAVRLFKRSGEQVHWGAKFDSHAFPLHGFFSTHYRPPIDDPKRVMPISSKFPYRVCSMLSVYGFDQKMTRELQSIAENELVWIAKQNSEERDGYSRQELLGHASAYLDSLVQKNQPLRDFCSLFAMEAFLARQKDDR
jgi:hypothetical protein